MFRTCEGSLPSSFTSCFHFDSPHLLKSHQSLNHSHFNMHARKHGVLSSLAIDFHCVSEKQIHHWGSVIVPKNKAKLVQVEARLKARALNLIRRVNDVWKLKLARDM